MFDVNSLLINTVSIACPLAVTILILISRKQIAGWLTTFVPQKNLKKVKAAVFVAAFAFAAFIGAWILALLVPGSPPPLWLSIFGAAAMAWIVVWSLLANEN